MSAEERLLEVIQNGGDSPLPKPSRPSGGLAQKILSVFKKNAVTSDAPRGFDIARMNLTLGVFIFFGVILSVANIVYLKPDIRKVYGRVAAAPSTQGHADIVPVSLEDLLNSIKARNLFQRKTEEAPPPVAVIPDATIPPPQAEPTGIMDSFQLVGIAWGAYPEAMVRESKEGRTFFLKQGEQLKGVLVKEILRDKVILEFAGQTKELM